VPINAGPAVQGVSSSKTVELVVTEGADEVVWAEVPLLVTAQAVPATATLMSATTAASRHTLLSIHLAPFLLRQELSSRSLHANAKHHYSRSGRHATPKSSASCYSGLPVAALGNTILLGIPCPNEPGNLRPDFVRIWTRRLEMFTIP
jgi:hypothetical protein